MFCDLKDLLRIDCFSQASSREDLSITECDFWGDENQTGLFYDHNKVHSNANYVTYCPNGYTYNTRLYEHNSTWKAYEVNDKMYKKIINTDDDSLCVLIGYAGCGKTVFINSLLRKYYSSENKVFNCFAAFYKSFSFDSGSGESDFIPTAIYQNLVQTIIEHMNNDSVSTIVRQNVWNKYQSLINSFLDHKNNISVVNPQTKKFFMYWASSNGELAKSLKETLNDVSNATRNNKIRAITDTVYEHYIREDKKRLDSYYQKASIILQFLWYTALFDENNLNVPSMCIVYDDLDAIRNPEVLQHFNQELQYAMRDYRQFVNGNKYDLNEKYYLKVFVTMRKVTYAKITSSPIEEYKDAERTLDYQEITCLEVSNLYNSIDVYVHRAKFWKKHNYHNASTEVANKIDAITQIDSNFLKNTLKLPSLLNHNIRAGARLLNSMDCQLLSIDNSIPNQIKTGIYIRSICDILHRKGVWINMGYNTAEGNDYSNPTTLSRTILQYMSMHSVLSKEFDDYKDVSLYEIYQTFKCLPVTTTKYSAPWKNDIEKAIKTIDDQKVKDNIATSISRMLLRNYHTRDPYEDEIWRRPLYYTSGCSDFEQCDDEEKIKQRLLSQLNDKNAKNFTRFCISDEGETFIDQYATHFEFYSARFNISDLHLWNYIEKSQLDDFDRIVSSVYKKVKDCTIKQLWLYMNYPEKKYLNLPIHYKTNDGKPQWHIVRTIFHHIAYLNELREHLKNITENEDFDKRILYWIYKYLELYCYDHRFKMLEIDKYVVKTFSIYSILKENVNSRLSYNIAWTKLVMALDCNINKGMNISISSSQFSDNEIVTNPLDIINSLKIYWTCNQ